MVESPPRPGIFLFFFFFPYVSFILAHFKRANNQRVKRKRAKSQGLALSQVRADHLQGKEDHPKSFQPEKEVFLKVLFLEPEALDNIQLDEG